MSALSVTAVRKEEAFIAERAAEFRIAEHYRTSTGRLYLWAGLLQSTPFKAWSPTERNKQSATAVRT